jgi:hypothetical protein
MNLQRILLLAAVLTATAASANRASAQCAAYGGGFGGYGFGAWDVGQLYEVLADNVPYYSAFPPVYYSYPVPRTYGYSPFAYPPGVMTPDVEFAQPQEIINPYMEGDSEEVAPAAEPASVDKTTSNAKLSQPLVIINPYVTDAKLAAAR